MIADLGFIHRFIPPPGATIRLPYFCYMAPEGTKTISFLWGSSSSRERLS